MAAPEGFISADSHLEVPFDRWTHRIPERFRDRAPRRVKLESGGDGYELPGRPVFYGGTAHFAGHTPETFDPRVVDYDRQEGSGPPDQRLREQDLDGVSAEVLFPGGGGRLSLRAFTSKDDTEAYVAILRAYNDYLAEEYCAYAPDRLLGVGVLPNVGADRDVTELEHCARIGLKAVALSTFPNGKSYPTAEDDRFWAAACEMPVAITVHTSMSRRVGERGEPLFQYPIKPEGRDRSPVDFVDRLARYGTRHCGATEAVQLVLVGVFDRFPALKVYWAENQIGWVPIFYEQLDLIYAANSHWVERILGLKRLERLPSEYLKEHAYWGFFDDPVGIEVRHRIGVDHVLWGSDFPHEVSRWPHSLEVMGEQMAGVPQEERNLMMRETAIGFFQLED